MKKLVVGFAICVAAIAALLYFSPAALMATAQFAERQVAGLSSEQVMVGDLSIHYYQGGPADGETLLMIHGFGANKDNWVRFAKYFTKRYQVIALDLPGFGDSSQPDASYDVGTQTERLAAFVKTLGLGKVHVIGNSMGGHIAALYAARHPEQVRSVALLDNAGVTSPNKSEFYQILERGEPNPLVARDAEGFARLVSFVFVQPPSVPANVRRYMAEQSSARSAQNDKVFSHLRERYIPLEPELPKIQVPTLLLWGDKDRVLDVSSIEVMKPLLKKPTVVIMKDCGHVPMIERPQETAGHYQAFLDSVKG
ncbi:abhydrolase domain-containing protein 6 [Pseudomonas sp. TE3786]